MSHSRIKFIAVPLFAVVVCAVTGIAIARRTSQQPVLKKVMSITQDAKPLTLIEAPGIALRHMGDRRNSREAEYLFQTPPELRSTVERYSFVVENTSDKAIVAFSFGYRFPRARQTNPEMGTLRNTGLIAHLTTAGRHVLMPPHSKVGYCMALGPENFDLQHATRHIQPHGPAHSQMKAEHHEQMYKSVLSSFAGFERLMKEADHWEVEVEGAIFADGTFVGTNSQRSFEQSNASILGARELADDLLGRAAKGDTHAELLSHAKTFVPGDWQEMLKPFGGRPDLAMKDLGYLAQLAKMAIAQRFVNMSEANGMQFLRHGQQNWRPLKWVK